MGRHRGPNKDTNPFSKVFRTIEPSHTRWADEADIEPSTPAEDDPIMNDPAHGADSEEIWEPPAITAGRRAYGGSLADLVAQVENADLDPELPDYLTGGFDAVGTDRPDTREHEEPARTMVIGSPPEEPPPDVNLAEYEPVRRTRGGIWLPFLAGSVALCVALAGGWYSHSALSQTPASDAHRAVQTATVTTTQTATVRPEPGGKPQPTVTAWRTKEPKPKATVRVTTTPPPGPTVYATRTIRPEPRVSVSIETRTRPVPGPTVTETCWVTITVRARDGRQLSEVTSCGS